MNEKEPRYITLSKQKCKEIGMDPDEIVRPIVTLSKQEIQRRQEIYNEILSVVRFFSEKLIHSLPETNILVVISDSDGYLLELAGDEQMKTNIDHLGITIGSLFRQEDTGTNVVSLALEQRHPVQVIGENHYHTFLHEIACYGAPFHYKDEDNLLGSISIMVPINFHNSMFMPMLSQLVDSIERELLLRKQNRKLNIFNQVMLSGARNGIIITNETGIIIEFTDFAKQIFYHTFTNSSSYELPIIGNYFKYVLTSEVSYDSKEVVFHNSTGDPIICLFDAQPIYEGEMVIGAYGQLRDMTDRYIMEEKIKAAEKQVLAGRIAAGIAHEIRNPLTTVRGYLQYFEKEVRRDIGQMFTELLIPEIDRANKIITDFLSIAKPSEKAFEKIQVKCFFTDYLWNFLKSEALLYNVELDFDIPSHAEKHYIFCNREELLQVFINLFQNSLQAEGDNPLTVRICTDIKDHTIQIMFRDNGKGIQPAILMNIFEPFFSTKDLGTGLGLSVSQKIIENHSGQITAKSIENTGTTFVIELPLHKETN
ncbi:signal transduction histidine kinase [Metabacillus crassostreae]|uniref:ATP-binding protein n=1 Tax=Metabacillus crassostreae TaxID=929098 RepID=UPI00195F2206|nr:ATP-binding protein [Metabacillus crassostreae]MBM7604825.1 signal transduction histidine kinase [Metabacillus crassostreae]